MGDNQPSTWENSVDPECLDVEQDFSFCEEDMFQAISQACYSGPVLKCIETESVTLSMTSSISPGVFRLEDMDEEIYLVLPVRIAS